jgi:hypothetical protein
MPGTVWDRAKRSAWMRDWRMNDPRGPMLVSAKARAKAKGLKFSITRDDIPIPAFCPVLGIPIRPNVGRHDGNSPTVDRIYAEHGYTKWNVRVISYRANNLKSDMTLAEARLILKDLEDRL